MIKKFIFLLLLSMYSSTFVFGENWVLISHLNDEAEPEPYEKEEFPEWAWYIRRFEIMLLGSFPIIYIMTSFSYDLYYLAASGGEDSFGSHRDDQDLINMVVITASICGVIAIADLIISLVKRGKKKNATVTPDGLSFSW